MKRTKQLLFPLIFVPAFAVMADSHHPTANDKAAGNTPLEQAYRKLGHYSLLRERLFKLPQVGKVNHHSQYQAGEQQSTAENIWTMVRSDLSAGYRWTERVTIDHGEALTKQGVLGKATGTVVINEVAPSDVDNPDAGYPIPLDIKTEATLKTVKSGTEVTQTLQLKPDDITGVTYDGFTLTRIEQTENKAGSPIVRETLQSTAFSYDDDEGFTLSIAPFELSATQSGAQRQNWTLAISKLNVAAVIEKIPLEMRLKRARLTHTNEHPVPKTDQYFEQLGTSKATIEGLGFYVDGIDAIKIASITNTQTIKKAEDGYHINAKLDVVPDSDIVGLLTGRVGMLIDSATLTLELDGVSATTLDLFASLQTKKSPRRLVRALKNLVEDFSHQLVFDGATLKATLVMKTDMGDANATLKLIRNPALDEDTLSALLKSGDYSAIESATRDALQVEIAATADPRVSAILGVSDSMLRVSMQPKIVDGKEVFNLSLSSKNAVFNGQVIRE